jgi:Asp-tRNA(Asn)/Glu-tRNA(Gln) amidotransferase A subunit family amidase
MSDPWKLTLSEGLGKIAEGTLDAAEWTRSLLARIDGCEEQIKAWVHVDREGAPRAAKEVDDALKADGDAGALGGGPIGVKDIIHVRGLLCEAGSPIYKGQISEEDAFCVAGLRHAGAIILGKTVTTQFATGDPSVTRNPWNPAHTPGGSSSGSAAAVATGMVPAALGSQTGGSVLRPSAYCGVIGFKPSYGLISRSDVYEVSWTLDHIGTLTRSVEDAARLLREMSGADDADETTMGFGFPAIPESPAPKKPVKAYFPKSDVVRYASEETAEWTLRAVEQLKNTGVDVEEIEFPLDLQKLHDAHRMIMNVEAAAYHEARFAAHADDFGPVIRSYIENGMNTGPLEYHRGLRQRGRLIKELDRMMESCDVLILPSFQTPPPLTGDSTGSAFFNEPASQTGLPAITLPLGRGDNNLPFGIQLIGRRLGDADLLSAARWAGDDMGWLPEFPEI